MAKSAPEAMASSARMDITWDPNKAASSFAKHGVAFSQAATVLLDPLALTVFDSAHSESEERWFTLGMSSDGKLLAVSHSYAHFGQIEVRVRLISARTATKHERQQYENEPR